MRPFTAPGLFAYRHMQAEGLLHFPDFADGDMNAEQRREALEQMVNVHRPLAAVVLFLGVVGLEDFIRDIGARLADAPGLDLHFPSITDLRPVVTKSPAPYARQDKDRAPLTDWPKVNALYQRVVSISPIPSTDLPILSDLALVRHTVAHHAALVRSIDAPRFQHWEVQANTLINPPVAFVREMLMLLYRTGRHFENAIADQAFAKVLEAQPPTWHESPPELVLTLIETFNWFGKLLTEDRTPPMPGTSNYEQELRAQRAANRATLTQLCIDELRKKHAV